MKTELVKVLVVALWCVCVHVSQQANAENTQNRPVDIALQSGGVLHGQVVDTEGQAQAAVPVELLAGGKEIARCVTDKEGKFQVAGLKGGVVEVASRGSQGVYRLWSPGTAPPVAQSGLLVVSEGDVVRGQGGRYRRRGVRGHGGGLLALMIDHPLVTAGAVGAAIAVPLAVSNDDSPSTP